MADGPALLKARFGIDQPGVEVPDVIAPFTTGFARADLDGNVWVRENHAGAIYDVIGRDGKLADRVTISTGWAVAGFGPGAVYLTRGNGLAVHLVKVGEVAPE